MVILCRSIILLCLCVLGASAKAPAKPYAGPWKTLSGSKMSFFQDGKPLLLDFWASWCGMCPSVVPLLNQVGQQYPQLHVVGVNMDEIEDRALANAFVRQTKMQYPSIIDKPTKLSEPLQIEGLPTLILLDAQGIELWRSLGEPESIVDSLEKYLPDQNR